MRIEGQEDARRTFERYFVEGERLAGKESEKLGAKRQLK